MKSHPFSILFLLLLCCGNNVNAQILENAIEPERSSIIITGDTLKISTGITIIRGQRIRIGEASGENGWYQSIGFKSPASWAVLLFHDTEINNQYQGTNNPEQVRENDKVKSYLKEGDSLLVTKIKRMGNNRKGYWYWVFLRDTRFPVINYRCNLETAITTREILVEN